MKRKKKLQSNLNSLNFDGSFTTANLNSFWNPYEILPLAQENKYLGKFSNSIMKLYVVYSLELPHQGDSNEYTQHTIIMKELKKSLYYCYLLPDLAPGLTLSGSNYPYLEQFSMVPKLFEPLKFDCISIQTPSIINTPDRILIGLIKQNFSASFYNYSILYMYFNHSSR